MRWNFSSERKQLAQRTASLILQNIQESKARSSAKSHVEYINREKAFEKRGGCIFHAHHLPKWAKDDPKIFFQAADIIAKHLSNHYYAYATHDKIGMLSDGQRHPHVHIMFSERLIDDVEKKKERAACNFFKYPLRKNIDSTFEERRKHGAPKIVNGQINFFCPFSAPILLKFKMKSLAIHSLRGFLAACQKNISGSFPAKKKTTRK